MVNVTQLLTSDRVIEQKQRSKKSKRVIAAVQNAVFTFTEAGKAIAKEKQELLDCVEEVTDDSAEKGPPVGLDLWT